MNAPHKPAPDAAEAAGPPDLAARPPAAEAGLTFPPLYETEAEREAAIQRLFAASRYAQPSDGVKMTRDEMHER